MRRVASLGVLCLAACASASTGPGAQTETVRIVDTGRTIQLHAVHTDAAMTIEVPATVEKLWNALPAVYDSLGIPVAQRNPATHTLGNDGLKLRRRLGDVPLRRYLDCGSTQGGPNTDTYEIFLTIQTQAQAGGAPGTSTVSSTLQAQARPINFAGDWVRCSTSNLLEKRIAEIAAALAQ